MTVRSQSEDAECRQACVTGKSAGQSDNPHDSVHRNQIYAWLIGGRSPRLVGGASYFRGITVLRLLQNLFGDGSELHVGCAFVDLAHFGVAVILFRRVISNKSISTKDFDA